MKTKSFKEYLEKRLNEDGIEEIKQQAELEVKILFLSEENLLPYYTKNMKFFSILLIKYMIF